MNELIESIFQNFVVDGISIPVCFLYYHGHGEPYITYMLEDTENAFSADDGLRAYVEYYDFDVYSKTNFYAIIERVKELLTANGFVWQASRTSSDMYEEDTGYFHRTLSFAFIRKGELNNG